MLDLQTLYFSGLVALLTITPGADTMLVVRSSLARGPRSGVMTTLGICSGLYIHASLSSAGLSILITSSAFAFAALKFLGSLYLCLLGAISLYRILKPYPYKEVDLKTPCSHNQAEDVSKLKSFCEGLLNNILNPKAAVFYLALLPQFIEPQDHVLTKSLLLASIHFVMAMAWLSMISLAIGKLRRFLTSTKTKSVLEAASGSVLIAFGIRLAMETR